MQPAIGHFKRGRAAQLECGAVLDQLDAETAPLAPVEFELRRFDAEMPQHPT